MQNDTEPKMHKAIEAVQKHFATIRTARANPELLDGIKVDYYGATVPLKQVASVSASEGKTLVINVFDKSAIHAIEKAIQTSGLGLNPMIEGSVMRLRMPDLTEERRKEFTKMAKQHAEEAKISIRNIRRDEIDVIKKAEKDKAIAEDDAKKQQDQVQKLTDRFTKQVDTLYAEKEKEIMTI